MAQNQVQDVVGVIGAGYVGLVAGSCFSYLGFNVGIVEIDPKKLESLSRGQSPIYEPGLTSILEDSLKSERLSFYPSTEKLFSKIQPEVVFIAVGTPENPDGSCNLNYVFQAVEDVVRHAKQDTVLVLKSTVPVGTARKVKEKAMSLNPKFRIGVVNNPEFLKEGSAVNDFLRPERVVLGGSEAWAIEKVRSFYDSLLHNGHPLFVTDHESAELGKLAANLMLASRVSVINQVSRLADALGGDIKQIESILKSDSRIGSKYLYAGLGYGGSCFPKDVKSFIFESEKLGVDASLAKSIDEYNDSQKLFFVNDIKKRFPKAAETTVSLLGVAFKPETDDIRESPALVLCQELSKAGYKIKVYDPKAMPQFKEWLEKAKLSGITLCNSSKEALSGSQAMILVTEWQEFQRLSPEKLKDMFSGKMIYDGKNTMRPERLRLAGFEYMGVGRGRAPRA